MKRKWQTFGLILTDQCNYQCKHCYSASGPDKSPTYVSNEVLDAIKVQRNTLNKEGFACVISLSGGGEPTLNLREFQRVLDHVMSWAHYPDEVELTTNGWWLARPETTRVAMEIMSPYINPDGSARPYNGRRFYVRISDDVWHQEFRAPSIRGRTRLTRMVNALQPRRLSAFAWIYLMPRYTICNDIGAAAANGCGTYDSGIINDCGDITLGYTVQGQLEDICCQGAKFNWGTVHDDPLMLQERMQAYFDYLNGQVSCKDCHRVAADYIADHRKVFIPLTEVLRREVSA